MAIQLQFRRGTAAQWASANTTLAQGELGLELDTSYFKIGDGNTAWTNLGYSISQLANNATNANNSLYLGGLIASGYQTTAGLSSNVATLAANSATYLGGNTALTLRTYTEDKAANAYSNAVSYVETQISGKIANSITANSATAYTNAVNVAAADASAKVGGVISYVGVVIGTANTAMVANAAAAYTNSTIFASNATNINTGTLSEARLPYRMNQDVRTTDNVTFNDMAITGNLTITGNTTIVGANNLVVKDSVISLHTLANLAPWTSNDGKLVGVAYHYYDNADRQALLAMNPANAFLTYYKTSIDAATADPTGTALGTIQADSFYAGNSTVYSTVNATIFSGTANNASYLNGNTAATLRTYTDDRAANAYSNGVSYTDTKIGLVNTAITANSATAYSNAVLYVDNKLYVNSAQLSTNLSNYQTTAGLSSNVATLTANNTSFVGTVSAVNVVSNSQLSSNLANYVTTTNLTNNLANYQTTAGLSANVATLTANNTSFVGAVSAANVVSNAQLVANLANYATTAAATAYAATAYANSTAYTDTRIGVVNTAITSNSSAAYSNAVTYVDTRIGVVNTAITSNSATAYTNAVAYVDAKLYVNSSQLSTNLSNYVTTTNLTNNLSNYQTTAGLSSNVATLTANNSTYLNGQLAAYYTNATNISTGTIAEARLPYRLNQNLTTTNNVTFANISLTGGTISTAPVNASDIVNKQYADAIATGVNFHPAVRLSTTVTFDATTATYNNGTNGVNATITDNSPYVAISLDGVAAAYGDRVLMRTVSNTAWNGIYVVSNTGSASYPWILTRAYDYDQIGSGVNEIDKGDLIYVLAGATLAGTAWVQQNDVTTIGTDGISFVQFSSKALYPLTEGAGLYYSVGGAYDGSAASTLAVNTTYIATLSSNNAAYLGGVAAASYVNTSGAYTITGVHTYNANLVMGAAAGISVNSSFGTAGQVLTSNGTTAYWAATGAGSFTNGQSISVANLVITGSVTANSSNGTAGQVLTSNSTGVYWAAPAASVTAANATSQSFTGDGTTAIFTLTNSVANQRNVIVSMNGLLQVPVTHYTISGTTLTFTDAPYTGAIVEARSIEGVALVSGGSGGSSISSGDLFIGSMLLGGM